MTRFVSISILLFWAAMFAGLAHASFGFLPAAGGLSAELQFNALVEALNGHRLMAVMTLIVAALFLWAAMSVAFGEAAEFRAVESHAYASAIAVMGVALVAGFALLAVVLSVPAVIAAALAASAAASHWLPVSDETPRADPSLTLARRMAISAAHNSMLSRISGRPTNRKA